GLEDVTRICDNYGINQKSIELAVLRYPKPGRFSDPGDSGSIILDRHGRLVGLLTGGEGPTDETDTTYLTHYWWIEKKIKEKCVASSTSSTRTPLPTSPPLCLSFFSRLVSSHQTRFLPPSPS
ncbi:hypothetical protein H4582DRAFT_1761666, partial [Lactarius indigo]